MHNMAIKRCLFSHHSLGIHTKKRKTVYYLCKCVWENLKNCMELMQSCVRTYVKYHDIESMFCVYIYKKKKHVKIECKVMQISSSECNLPTLRIRLSTLQ